MIFFLTMVTTIIHMVTMELNPTMILDPMVPVDINTMDHIINTETVDMESMDMLILVMVAMATEAMPQGMEVMEDLEVVMLLDMALELTQLFMV